MKVILQIMSQPWGRWLCLLRQRFFDRGAKRQWCRQGLNAAQKLARLPPPGRCHIEVVQRLSASPVADAAHSARICASIASILARMSARLRSETPADATACAASAWVGAPVCTGLAARSCASSVCRSRWMSFMAWCCGLVPRSGGDQSPNIFCLSSRRCCASSDSVAVGRASKRPTPMGSPVSSQ